MQPARVPGKIRNHFSQLLFIDIGFWIAWDWQYPGRLALCSDFEEKLA